MVNPCAVNQVGLDIIFAGYTYQVFKIICTIFSCHSGFFKSFIFFLQLFNFLLFLLNKRIKYVHSYKNKQTHKLEDKLVSMARKINQLKFWTFSKWCIPKINDLLFTIPLT